MDLKKNTVLKQCDEWSCRQQTTIITILYSYTLFIYRINQELILIFIALWSNLNCNFLNYMGKGLKKLSHINSLIFMKTTLLNQCDQAML